MTASTALIIAADLEERARVKLREATLSQRLTFLARRNARTTQSILGDVDVDLSLTTHGPRLRNVYRTIESIGRGQARPRTITLWLDDGAPPDADLPVELDRLRRRGLTVSRSFNYGPHTKYFPHVMSATTHTRALVTADDDIVYPRDWLASLARARRRFPTGRVITCHRARKIALDADGLAPYGTWDYVRGTHVSPLHFATGVAGVWYPPLFLNLLHEAGAGFTGRCERADDIWLHATALRNGYNVAQARTIALRPSVLPYAKHVGLELQNVDQGGNDRAVLATYTADDVGLLRAAART